jgi:high-affinity nickel permease
MECSAGMMVLPPILFDLGMTLTKALDQDIFRDRYEKLVRRDHRAHRYGAQTCGLRKTSLTRAVAVVIAPTDLN